MTAWLWLAGVLVFGGQARAGAVVLPPAAGRPVDFNHVVQTPGRFSTVLLAVAAWFAWQRKRGKPAA